jgi:radical SAM protein with 4Fe4S-binding SPASM domain
MASQRVPIVVLSAAHGATRENVDELIEHAAGLRLRVGLDLGNTWAQRWVRTSSASSGAGRGSLRDELVGHRAAGLDQVELELDTDSTVPEMRAASTERLLRVVDDAHDLDLAVGVHTPLEGDAGSRIRELADLLAEHEVESWQISFFECTGDPDRFSSPGAREVHATFAELYRIEREARTVLTVVEAPHYRRYRIEREQSRDDDPTDASVRDAVEEHCGVRADVGLRRHAADAGRRCLYLDRHGEVFPSPRLPISAGNIRERALIDIYRNSDVFTLLRDPDRLAGKCSQCGFSRLCGGSRARAWHGGGDCMGTDPACAFKPAPAPDDQS